jgi:hypothetical protein
MPLLNYTTLIDAFMTISEIQKLLVMVGSIAGMNTMDMNGNFVTLSFHIKLGEQDRAFS